MPDENTNPRLMNEGGAEIMPTLPMGSSFSPAFTYLKTMQCHDIPVQPLLGSLLQDLWLKKPSFEKSCL